MKNKTCRRCARTRPLTDFHRHGPSKDGHNPACRFCISKAEKYRRQLPGGKARATWDNIKKRLQRQSEYVGVELRFTRAAFLTWMIPALQRWTADHPGQRPSIDRIDPAGHYEPGNVRILELGENSRLSRAHKNAHAPEGTAWCGACKQYKPRSAFGKNRARRHGLQHRCGNCRRHLSPRRRNQNWRNDQAPEGTAWCFGCQTYHPRDRFYTSKANRSTGLQNACKEWQKLDHARKRRKNFL